MTNKIENVQPLRSAEEIDNMREAIGMTNAANRNLLLFNLGINTGLRVGDIVKLRVEEVKGATSLIIREGKTSKPRKVYLNNLMAQIADYINNDLGGINEGWLFPSRQSNGKQGHISTTQAYRILNSAGKACNYDYVGTHTMRKTFGYHYYQRTKDIATLMEIFNHANQATTKRYIGIRDEEIEQSLKGFVL